MSGPPIAPDTPSGSWPWWPPPGPWHSSWCRHRRRVAGAVKGWLAVISVGDQGTGLVGAVAGRPFSVLVEARDPQGVPLVLTQDTRVRLSLVDGLRGSLGGVLEGTIAKRTSRGTVTGATYAPFGNAGDARHRRGVRDRTVRHDHHHQRRSDTRSATPGHAPQQP